MGLSQLVMVPQAFVVLELAHVRIHKLELGQVVNANAQCL